MFLAMREMRRAKTRFALLVAAIALLVFLILFQQALQRGLVTSFVGAIRTQSAPVLVYSTDGQRTLQGSVIPPPLEELIFSAEGIDDGDWIGQGTFTVRVNNTDDTSDAAIIGARDRSLGGIESVDEGRLVEAPGEAVGSASDFEVGDRVRIVPVGVASTGPRPNSRWWVSSKTPNCKSHPRSSHRGTTTKPPPAPSIRMRGRSCRTPSACGQWRA